MNAITTLITTIIANTAAKIITSNPTSIQFSDGLSNANNIDPWRTIRAAAMGDRMAAADLAGETVLVDGRPIRFPAR